jgi:hypothetical protein
MYDVVQKVGGNLVVNSSWGEDQLAQAKAAYFDTCKALYADEPTKSGVVKLLDNNLDVVDGCVEYIKK